MSLAASSSIASQIFHFHPHLINSKQPLAHSSNIPVTMAVTNDQPAHDACKPDNPEAQVPEPVQHPDESQKPIVQQAAAPHKPETHHEKLNEDQAKALHIHNDGSSILPLFSVPLAVSFCPVLFHSKVISSIDSAYTIDHHRSGLTPICYTRPSLSLAPSPYLPSLSRSYLHLQLFPILTDTPPARHQAPSSFGHLRKDLVWDNKLAANATAYAKKLAHDNAGLKHSTGDQRPGQGENLAWSKPNGSLTDGSKMWVDEKKNYSGQKIGEGDFGSYGHYTQVCA